MLFAIYNFTQKGSKRKFYRLAFKSIVSKKRFNGEGNHYFELSINSIPDIAKIVNLPRLF